MPEGPHSCRVEIGLRLEPAAPREPVSDPVPSRLAPTTAAPVLLAASCFWARSVRCCKQRTIALSDHRGAATAGRLRCGTAKVATQTSHIWQHFRTVRNSHAPPAQRRAAAQSHPRGGKFTSLGAPPALASIVCTALHPKLSHLRASFSCFPQTVAASVVDACCCLVSLIQLPVAVRRSVP